MARVDIAGQVIEVGRQPLVSQLSPAELQRLRETGVAGVRVSVPVSGPVGLRPISGVVSQLPREIQVQASLLSERTLRDLGFGRRPFHAFTRTQVADFFRAVEAAKAPPVPVTKPMVSVRPEPVVERQLTALAAEKRVLESQKVGIEARQASMIQRGTVFTRKQTAEFNRQAAAFNRQVAEFNRQVEAAPPSVSVSRVQEVRAAPKLTKAVAVSAFDPFGVSRQRPVVQFVPEKVSFEEFISPDVMPGFARRKEEARLRIAGVAQTRLPLPMPFEPVVRAGLTGVVGLFEAGAFTGQTFAEQATMPKLITFRGTFDPLGLGRGLKEKKVKRGKFEPFVIPFTGREITRASLIGGAGVIGEQATFGALLKFPKAVELPFKQIAISTKELLPRLRQAFTPRAKGPFVDPDLIFGRDVPSMQVSLTQRAKDFLAQTEPSIKLTAAERASIPEVADFLKSKAKDSFKLTKAQRASVPDLSEFLKPGPLEIVTQKLPLKTSPSRGSGTVLQQIVKKTVKKPTSFVDPLPDFFKSFERVGFFESFGKPAPTGAISFGGITRVVTKAPVKPTDFLIPGSLAALSRGLGKVAKPPVEKLFEMEMLGFVPPSGAIRPMERTGIKFIDDFVKANFTKLEKEALLGTKPTTAQQQRFPTEFQKLEGFVEKFKEGSQQNIFGGMPAKSPLEKELAKTVTGAPKIGTFLGEGIIPALAQKLSKAELQRIKEGQRLAELQRQQELQLQRQGLLPSAKQFSGLRELQLAGVKQLQLTGQKSLTLQTQRFSQVQKISQLQRQRLLQQTLQLTRTKTRQRQKQLEKEKTRLKPLALVLPQFQPFPKQLRQVSRLAPGFLPFARVKGKFVPLTAFPVTKAAAQAFGARFALETPARTFKVVPAMAPARRVRIPILPAGFLQMFRPAKTKELAGALVEKTEFAIREPEELKGITFKGLRKLAMFPPLRKKKKKKRSKKK